jgi:hypothetical protein
MKSQRNSLLVFLFAVIAMGFASRVCAQQPHSVQSAAPALQMPASTLPVNVDPEAGKMEIKSTASDAIGGARPVEAVVPRSGGSVHSTVSEIEGGVQSPGIAPAGSGVVPAAGDPQRPLTPAEIEELKDGK